MSLRRVAQYLAVVGASAALVGVDAGQAFAYQQPRLTPDEVSFSIPAGSKVTWTLNLWSDGILRASQSGTRGTLTVAVPGGTACNLQADVKRGGRYYSGIARTFSACGPTTTTSPTTTSTSTTVPPGWWHRGPGWSRPPFVQPPHRGLRGWSSNTHSK